jgi:AcrR family transcriptional regulator
MKVNMDIQESRKPGRPPVDRRDEILDAAQQLYERIGFEKTTIGDVARELGMSPANLYRSFPNRRAIDEAVAKRRLSTIDDAAWLVARRATDDPAAAMHELGQTVLREMRRILFVDGHMNRLCAVASQERWPVVERFLDSLRGAVRHIIIEGQRGGHFAAADADATAGVVVRAMTPVWHPQMIEIHRNDDLEAMAGELSRLVLRSLKNVE